MKLKTIFDKYNCDKGYKHAYHKFYSNEFEPYRYKKINLLEIGILNGESIKSWLEYFPNANIFCVDTFQRIPSYKIEILKNERVFYKKLDSTSNTASDKVGEWNTNFDIIIDDGLHTPEANRKSFLNFFPMLDKSGTYFIEDFWPLFDMTEKEKEHKFLIKHQSSWNESLVMKLLEEIKLYNYHFFDNRNITNHLDSFIIKIKK